MQAPAIQPRLREALRGLREAGIEPGDAEIVWLGALAEKCSNPLAGGVQWLAGSPVVYAGLAFWPWTRLAEEWFRRWYLHFRNSEDPPDLALYAFAHVRSRPGDKTLLELSDYAAVKAAISAWYRALPMPFAQLVAVCEKLQALERGDDELIANPDKPPRPAEPPHGNVFARYTAWLCKAFPGTTPDYWTSGISKREIEDLTDEMAAVAERTPGEAPDPNSPRMRAIHNFRMAVKWVMEGGKRKREFEQKAAKAAKEKSEES